MRLYTHSGEREQGLLFFLSDSHFQIVFIFSSSPVLVSLCAIFVLAGDQYLIRSLSLFHTLTHLVYLPYLVEHSVSNQLCSGMLKT